MATTTTLLGYRVKIEAVMENPEGNYPNHDTVYEQTFGAELPLWDIIRAANRQLPMQVEQDKFKEDV